MLSAEIFEGKTTTWGVLFLRIHLELSLLEDVIIIADLMISIKDGGLIGIKEVILICSGLRHLIWLMLLTI